MNNILCNDPCFIIARLSRSNARSLDLLIDSIKAAKQAGANAVRLQTYIDDDTPLISSKKTNQYISNRYQQDDIPLEWHEPIFNIAKRLDIICFSSPFSQSSVDFLEQLNPPIYKIASYELKNIPLIRKIAKLGKPIILSTGIATYDEISKAITTCLDENNTQITLLKSTSAYPTPMKEVNLIMMQQFSKDFNVNIGISDHTIGTELAVLSVILGAKVLEKHFLLQEDSALTKPNFFLNEIAFKTMVAHVREMEQQAIKLTEMELLFKFLDEDSKLQKAIGNVSYELTQSQLEQRLKNNITEAL